MNKVMYLVMVIVLSGCMSGPARTNVLTRDDSSCGLRCLTAYGEIKGRKGHRIKNIEADKSVSMLELKNAALQLGYSAEGCLLDVNELDGLETYAILPVGMSDGTKSNPLHFVLVRFTNGKVFSIDYQTLQETPLKFSSLKRIWRGHALLLAQR